MGKKLERYRATAVEKIATKLHPGESILHTVTAVTISSSPSGAYGAGVGGHGVVLAVTARRLLEVPTAQKGGVTAIRWFNVRDLKIRRGIISYSLRFTMVLEYPQGRGELQIKHGYTIGRSASTRPFLEVVKKESLARHPAGEKPRQDASENG